MTRVAMNLNEIAADYDQMAKRTARRVVVCAGTGCVANGALEVHAAFVQELEAAGLKVTVELNREGDADAICAELFTEQLREIVENEPDGCGSLLEGRVWYYQHDIEMKQVSVDGDTATTRVLENGVDLRVDLVRVDGEWRISFFTVLEDG